MTAVTSPPPPQPPPHSRALVGPRAATPDNGDRAVWAAAFGSRWRWYLAALGALVFAAGALAPLVDIDLPMHLATGEWIVRHHALPTVEPFAWTRAGAPYYAYSWLADVAYFSLLRAAGPLGLHLLYGATTLAAGAAVVWLGRVAGWRPWTSALTAALHVVLLFTIVASLRPQATLFVAVPMAWAAVEWLLADDRAGHRRWQPYAVLAAACALAANTHLLFPATAAPLVLAIARPWRRPSTILLAAVAVLVGWACNPYALDYAGVFHLYFAPNALFATPSPITEFAPGFVLFSLRAPVSIVVVLLALLPWAAAPLLRGRERAAFAALWLAGLVTFALHVRALALWWLAVLPLVAAAAERLPQTTSAAIGRAQRLALAAIAALLALRGAIHGPSWWREEGDVTRRTMPTYAATSVEPLARWLETHTRPGAGARVLTNFNFGSYIVWRMPGFSPSIDGRTIFPDSAAQPEAARVISAGPVPLGPWRSADVAILPARFPVAAVLDTAAGWHRVATVDSSATVPASAALWVTDAWWRRAGRAPLPPVAGGAR